MAAIDPDDPEIRRQLAAEARRQRVQDAPDEQVRDDLRDQLGTERSAGRRCIAGPRDHQK